MGEMLNGLAGWLVITFAVYILCAPLLPSSQKLWPVGAASLIALWLLR